MITSERLTAAPDDAAAAAPTLHLTTPQAVLGLAVDTRAAWGALIATVAGQPAPRMHNQVEDALSSVCVSTQPGGRTAYRGTHQADRITGLGLASRYRQPVVPAC